MSSKLTNHANHIKSNRTKSLDKSKNFIDNHNIKFPLSKHTQKPANFIVSTSTATQKPTFKPTKNQIQLYKIQLEASHQQYPSTKQSQSKNKSRPNTRHLPRKSPITIKDGSSTMNKYANFDKKPSTLNSHNLRSINSANKNNVKGILQKNLGIQNHKQSKSTTQIKMNKTFNNQSIGKRMDFSHSPEIRKKELSNKLSPNLVKKKPTSKSPLQPSICFNQFRVPLSRKDLGSRGSKKNITQNKFKKMIPNNNVLKKNVTNVSTSNKNIFPKKQQKFVTSEEFTHVDLNKKNVSNNNNHNDKKGNVDNLHKHEPQIEKKNITPVVGGVLNQKVTDNIKIISTQNLKEHSQDNSIIHNNSNKITQNENDIQIENNNNNEFKTPQEKIISETPPIKEEPIKHNCRKIKEIYEFTHVGFDGEQDKEDNQDSYFIFHNFTGNPNYKYFSVCDGHGVEGHFVSSFIKAVLPLDLSNYLANIDIHTYSNLHEDIIEIFKQTNTKLVEEENINSIFSGSTCVSVIYSPEKLICPNVGDSRAVLGKFINNKWIAQNLTRDHKPSEEDEAARVRQSNGRIQPLIDEGEEIGPLRVWVQEDDVPGLAMTRSFGDRVGKEVGVSCEPEIKEFPLSEEDKFMIIASDGVWEFIDSQECVDMIKDFYLKNDMDNCCEYIYEESKKRWLKEEEVIDDTTMIIVVFE